MPKIEKKTLFLLVLSILLLFVGIFDHSLWTPDEPRVAEISREMDVTGDYLIPRLSGKPFLEQPPLYYATASIFWHTFGTGNEGFGRLASVLFAAATVLTVFFGTRALYTEHAAALSALILATTWDFFLISHKMVVDNALVFFITAALFGFSLGYQGIFKKGFIVFWICLACAFLTKGFIGIAIPCVAAGIFLLRQKDLRVMRKAWVIPGILMLCFTTLAWTWGLYAKGGKDFLSTFFLYNNLGRFLNIIPNYQGGHEHHFYYYIDTVLLNGLPWSITMIAALIAGRRSDEKLRFFSSWLFGGFILLSIAFTKRGLYFLPMYPAMAVISGQWISGLVKEGSARWEKIILRGLLVLFAALALIVPAGYIKLGGTISVAVTVFLVSAGLVFLASRTITKSLPEWLPVGFAVLLIAWATPLFLLMDTMKTCKPFYQEASRIVGGGKVIGYNLTETVEAFSAFYGGFIAESIEDKNACEYMILSKTVPYVIVDQSNESMLKPLRLKGQKMLYMDGRWRRNTQLWGLIRTKQGCAFIP